MVLGLGTGSTAAYFVRELSRRIQNGLNVECVPTSRQTAELAAGLGIPLGDLNQHPALDLTIDGADEIGPGLALIKGGGGALLREKIVACASREMIVIADETKLVGTLGHFPLPIEVIGFGASPVHRLIEEAAERQSLSVKIRTRQSNGADFITDEGNIILDASFGHISNPRALASELDRIAGIVTHGLFIDIASRALVAGPDGIRQVKT